MLTMILYGIARAGLGYLVIIYDTNKINYVQAASLAEASAMCVLVIVRFELSYVCCPHFRI